MVRKINVRAEQGWECTADELKTVTKLSGYGLTAAQIADFLGVSRSSFFEKKTAGSELDKAYRKGKAEAATYATGKLFSLIRKENPTAIIFYLKTQHAWKETNRTEHTGENGEPIKVEDTTKENAREHLKRVLTQVLDKTEIVSPEKTAD